MDKTEIKCCLLSIDSLAVVESTAFHTRFNIHDLSALFAKKKKKKETSADCEEWFSVTACYP